MNAPHTLHRGGLVRIDDAMLGKIMCNPRGYHPRLDGPPVHKRIGFNPPIDCVGLAAKAIIVAGAGAVVAMWVSL